jgi:hypothetical protein
VADFYDEGALRRAALDLFNGWGYHFYRRENQLRADDQLVRSKADWLLGNTRALIVAAESAYRRETFGTPTRAQPFPDPMVVANAQKLERLAADIGVLKGRMQSQPTPENDRMTQRFRHEADTLVALIASDERLVGQCALLHATVERRAAAWLLDHLDTLEEGLAAIGQTLREREAALLERRL